MCIFIYIYTYIHIHICFICLSTLKLEIWNLKFVHIRKRGVGWLVLNSVPPRSPLHKRKEKQRTENSKLTKQKTEKAWSREPARVAQQSGSHEECRQTRPAFVSCEECQFLAPVPQKSDTVVNSWLCWLNSVRLSSTFGSGGSKSLDCRQLLVQVAQKCETVVNFWLRLLKSAGLTSSFGSVVEKSEIVSNGWLRCGEWAAGRASRRGGGHASLSLSRTSRNKNINK